MAEIYSGTYPFERGWKQQKPIDATMAEDLTGISARKWLNKAFKIISARRGTAVYLHDGEFYIIANTDREEIKHSLQHEISLHESWIKCRQEDIAELG